ncbi:putative Tripeptidyl-peptidase SED4 [Hypsibius exemplaris]|uniref:Tripeptidyl-peptidase SED4 n=1 Tax=Hypsibius exemplaris TaxID=2072580 RepID=A0A1W0XAU9_HYPEX|nr:putative Tripeptidyl-peptidase SED4 [Hypsibius exemplaris]
MPVPFHIAFSPVFAAIVLLLNNDRLNQRRPVLGFLNPWLYSIGKAGLADIVDGGSTGCGANDTDRGVPTPLVPFASWNATASWNPVTGLGTPRRAGIR